MDRRVSADGPASTPAHIHNREGKEKKLGLCFFDLVLMKILVIFWLQFG